MQLADRLLQLRLVRYPRLYLSVVPLGRQLFFDKRLSRDKSLACASCHVPNRAFTDGRALPLGITGARGRRNAPTVLNRAYGRSMFWDGRAASLEEQALAPLISPREFGTSYEEVLRRLRADPQYRRLFRRAFGTEEIRIDGVAKALASFERTLLSGDSAFDRYETLKDSRALSGPTRRGLEVFRGKAGCVVCHNVPLFSDERFHNTGVSWEKPPLDLGRHEVTGREEDKGVFKTPSLRDVARTAPYMHDGSLKTLDEVIDFYDRGAGQNPSLDTVIKPLHLTPQEKGDLGAFLNSLTGR